MTKFKEINYYIVELKVNSGENYVCPKCPGGVLYYQRISCPDNDPKCLVQHFGYKCHSCKCYFQKIEEK